MEKDQQPTAGPSKTEKPQQFRFSVGKAFLRDYFHKTNKAPRKKERQQILAHLKELGESEATDVRVANWFSNQRQLQKKKLPPPPLSTLPPESKERTWVDARHKSLWPSLTKESLESLRELYVEHVGEGGTTDPPYDLWAEGLDAKVAHVRMWCRFRARESTPRSLSGAAPVATTSSQAEHSQLPTPGASVSPEPHPTFATLQPLSPNPVKDEPPVSPVVETTQYQQQFEGPKEKSSMGLHEAIESAFSAPLYPPAPYIQPPNPPSPASRINQQQKTSSNPGRIIDVVPPPMPPSTSTNTSTDLASAPLPSALTTSLPSNPEPPPSPPPRESPAPPSPEEPIPGPSTRPDRDIARERADLVTGVAAKMNELAVMLSSPYGVSVFAGSIESISQRNQQFLNDVTAGRFAHMHLTSEHLPDHQAPSPMPEFNPQRILAERRNSKGKGKERAQEDEMEVD